MKNRITPMTAPGIRLYAKSGGNPSPLAPRGSGARSTRGSRTRTTPAKNSARSPGRWSGAGSTRPGRPGWALRT